MIRARYERRGPVPHEVIAPAEFETPWPSAGQALVEVVAAPINPADMLTLTGEYGQLPPLPAIGGREGVGRVAELGADTREITVGQLISSLRPRVSSRSARVVASHRRRLRSDRLPTVQPQNRSSTATTFDLQGSNALAMM